MDKLKTTKKAIKGAFLSNVIKVGYCGLYWLLFDEQPSYYSAGVYGWSCDYYVINFLCISTGYRPTGREVDYNIVKDYNDTARRIVEERRLLTGAEYDKASEKLKQLLDDFINEVKN